jgi:TPR repeat protein
VIAQKNLAYCYKNGEGTPINLFESFYWCKKAAERGNIEAQNRLAICYENGEGTEVNMEKSFHWYLESAEGGNVNAQYNVSISYENGEGTPIDLQKSLYWIEVAATRHDSDACLRAANFLKEGKGCEINLEKAYDYYLRALNSNVEKVWKSAQIQVRNFQERGLTKLAYFHNQKMYTLLCYNHDKIGNFNNIHFYFVSK